LAKKRKKNKKNIATGQGRPSPPTETAFPMATTRVSKDDAYNPALIGGYLQGLNIVESKIPFEIFDIVDRLVISDPYVNKYHHTTVALGNSGHDLIVSAPSEQVAQVAIDEANRLADRCFPLAGGMPGLISGCFSQLARTTATCVEWVPDKTLSQIRRGYLVPIKSIRFIYDNNQDYVLCQNQQEGIVQLNRAQTVYYNAMVRDGNPYAVPPIVSAIEPCATHRAIVEKISLWMDKVSALGVMLAEVEPPPRLPGESQEKYNSKAKDYLQELSDSIASNMSSGLGVAYNNVKFQFQNTQAAAAGAKDLLQMVLQGVFAGLQRDPIMFGWNYGNSDAFVKVIYEELMQSLAFYQRGVKRVIEHGHQLNLILRGMGDCRVDVLFHAPRSLDQFRDSEAEYMDSKKILEQLAALAISPAEARDELGYNKAGVDDNQFTATFSDANNRYTLQRMEKKVYNVAFEHRVTPRDDYNRSIDTILKDANDNGMAAFAMWFSLQGNITEELVVNTGLKTYFNYAENSINQKDVSSVAAKAVSDSWEGGQGDPTLFAGVEENRKKDRLSADEIAAIYFLAYIVEPYLVKNFMSRSEWRQERARSAIQKLYKQFGLDSPNAENMQGFKDAVASYMSKMSTEAGSMMSDTTTTRAETWGALYALKNAGIKRFMIVGPDDDRKCDFCRSMLYKTFSVEAEIKNIADVVGSGDPNIGDKSEFITKRYADGIGGLSDEELQADGVITPPYHNFCRDKVVAIS
jgi:hypothetical protein